MSLFAPKRALAVTPHADDLSLFAGGLLSNWSAAGCEITVLRVTQDEKDSFVHDIPETIAINRREFIDAMRVLGVQRIIDLDYRDCELMDAHYGGLREKLIRAIRECKPDVVVSFDPSDVSEENPDHIVTARATADAVWAAAYRNFHPEHQEMNLTPHRPHGCYYFTRQFVVGETIIDISHCLEKKVEAVISHRNMLATMMHDQKARVEKAGFKFPSEATSAIDGLERYWRHLIESVSSMSAIGSEFVYAERFRSTLMTEHDPLLGIISSI